MLTYTEGKRIDRIQALKGSQRAQAFYAELVSAAEALLALAKGFRGRSNKDIGKFTAQIRSLIEKWRD